ncbi:restriction endonuclease subunit S [Nonomuraea sp. NPDC050556]|uniref:restriction endonuclease subunit S n=1 Tax=Nonomuraea sp. NPDC050556 TaxID=3364369 RepID=UPI00379EC121
MSELPTGWIRATLAELGVEAQPGFASGKHNSDGNGIVHLRPMNVTRDGKIDLSDVRYVADESDRRVTAGDVLFNNTNSPELVGKTALITSDEPLAFSNHMTRLRTPAGIRSDFLAIQIHWLWIQGYFKKVLNNHVNQASVATRKLLETPVDIPPLAEQQLIVTVLEEHLARFDTGISSMNEVSRLQAAWENSLLATATVKNPKSIDWDIVPIGDIATVSTGATPLRSRRDYYENGTIPWATSSLVNSTYIDATEQFITEKALSETSVKLFPPGTLLVAMYGEGRTRGRCSELRINSTTNQACAAIQLRREYDFLRPWVKLILDAKYEQNRKLASGGVQPNLNLGLIRNIEIPLPSPSERSKILAEIYHLRSMSAQLREVVKGLNRRAVRLHQELLRAAFSGRLVPQDPDDEPASVLLDRIQTENAAKPKVGRVSRAKKKSVATQGDLFS